MKGDQAEERKRERDELENARLGLALAARLGCNHLHISPL